MLLNLKTVSPPAVERALTILEEVASSTRGLRLPEIALRLGLPKSSTHSVLVGMERRGYLQRNTSGRYLFGPKILSLANLALCNMALREIAYPVLADLMRRTGLAAKMAILDRDQAVLIEQVHPPFVLAPATWLGKRLPLHCTAAGKALAAFRPRRMWSRLATEHRLHRHNANTICSPAQFLNELAETRERGYAIDNEEYDVGARCIAAPVFGESGEVTASIGFTGTTSEIPEDDTERLGKLLIAAAREIAEKLGAHTDAIAAEPDAGVPPLLGAGKGRSQRKAAP
jgi:DNA-binding IclR family transcriptional regulator